jgi:tryptophan halogenase
VGGGTAGWLAAMMLQRHGMTNRLGLEISVVESSKIPTIGVGEGTTAVFRQMMLELGIDEAAFIRETGATIKLGIRHKEWRRKGHSYDGPIDDPNLLALSPALKPAEQESALDIYAVANGRGVSELHLFGELINRDKSPFGVGPDGVGLLKAGPSEHAMHFDQARVGAYLRDISKGVTRIDAEVGGVRRNAETGDIEALLTTDGAEVTGDFYVDCTGFRRKLICGEMGARWISYSDILPVNRAMPFWLEHEQGAEIPPYTLAWAQEAGWMWSIPTQDRIGCGYVYSDRFRTPDEAQAEIERRLGRKIEPRNDLKFDSGRVDEAWIGNCLALGLSSSFLEPLEATSIHATIVQVMLLRRLLFRTGPVDVKKVRDDYNRIVARQLNDFRTFINLHYTGEREEPFWQHARRDCLHDSTKAILEQWSRRMPQRSQFPPFAWNMPHINEQLYYPVVDGLGHLSRAVAKSYMNANPKVRAHARKVTEAMAKDNKKAAAQCLGHREFLERIAARTVEFRWAEGRAPACQAPMLQFA